MVPTPPKFNIWNPKNEGLEDEFPRPKQVYKIQVPILIFQGAQLSVQPTQPPFFLRDAFLLQGRWSAHIPVLRQ